MNDPETFAIEISGLETLLPHKKQQVFFILSELLGKIIIQNSNKNELITCIYNREDTNSFAHHDQIIPFYTDGAFLNNPPRLVGIWVEQEPIKGGETTLVNVLTLLQHITTIENNSLLTKHIPFHIQESYHLPHTSSYILASPISANQIRFRIDLMLKGVEESNEITHKQDLIIAINSLNDWINQCKEKLSFLMKKDHVYFFNNYYNLHNRKPFTGERKIWRTWIN